MNAKEQKKAASEFVAYWTARKGSEKGEDQAFWNSLLGEVLGVTDVKSRIKYQEPVYFNNGSTKFLDAWIPETAVLIEHKSRYRYSAAIVYNNFPWPGGGLIETALPTGCGADGVRALPSPGGAADLSTSTPLHGSTPSPNPCNSCNSWFDTISQTAQSILDARALYPESSLADLYDPLTMPPELRKAHQANDAAVMKAYGFAPDLTEPEIVSRLFEMYAKLTADSSEGARP